MGILLFVVIISPILFVIISFPIAEKIAKGRYNKERCELLWKATRINRVIESCKTNAQLIYATNWGRRMITHSPHDHQKLSYIDCLVDNFLHEDRMMFLDSIDHMYEYCEKRIRR